MINFQSCMLCFFYSHEILSEESCIDTLLTCLLISPHGPYAVLHRFLKQTLPHTMHEITLGMSGDLVQSLVPMWVCRLWFSPCGLCRLLNSRIDWCVLGDLGTSHPGKWKCKGTLYLGYCLLGCKSCQDGGIQLNRFDIFLLFSACSLQFLAINPFPPCWLLDLSNLVQHWFFRTIGIII